MAGKIDEFAFVLLAGLIIIIIMLFAWGIPSPSQIPVVSPSSKSLTIRRGSSESFLLTINVTSKMVTLTPKGTIKDWISFSDNNFDSSGLSMVEVTVRVPLSAQEREYLGSIDVESSEGGKVTVPLSIIVTKESEAPSAEASRTIYIGDFTVTYASYSEVVKSIENLEVRKGLFEEKKESFGANVEKNLDLVTNASLIIDIVYTNHEGNLIVKFNNQVVYDEKALPGEIIIPIDKSLIKAYNVVEISTSSPGLKFWSTSIYRIDRIQLKVNYFGEVEKRQTFTVSRDEITHFKEGRVEFYVKDYQGEGKLSVKINGYLLHEEKRRGQFILPFNYVDVGLVKGFNSISFSTERESTYEIENAKIIIIHEEV